MILLATEEFFDGDAVDGHSGDVAVADLDTAEIAFGEAASGQGAIFESDGAHFCSFGVEGMTFWGHADIVDICAANLSALDLEVAKVCVDDLHIAAIDVVDHGSAQHDLLEPAIAHGAF